MAKQQRSISYVPLSDLTAAADERNPRAHESLAEVRGSIEQLGFIEPVVMDARTDRMIAGHGRVKVLAEMRDEEADPPNGVRAGDGDWHIPVVTGWASADDAEAARAIVVLNRTSETGGWDDRPLLLLLEELSETSAGLAGSGFDDDALDDLRAKLEEVVEESRSAVTQDYTYQEFLERYEKRGVRSLVCDYSLPVYRWLIEALDDLRESGQSNGEVIVSLVAKAHGTVPPEDEEEDQAA